MHLQPNGIGGEAAAGQPVQAIVPSPSSLRCRAMKRTFKARLTSAARNVAAACLGQGVREHLAEGLALVVRELTGVPEAIRKHDGLYQRHWPYGQPQRGSACSSAAASGSGAG